MARVKRYQDGGDVNDLLKMLSDRHSVSRPFKKVKQRKGVRSNEDGTESTHLMRTETLDGENWFSFPSLFQNEDGSWVDMSKDEDWMGAYKEAQKRGEVYDFGKDKETALAFGEGSWKNQLKPNYTNILSSLVSESTQPSGYTQPVLPVDNKIKLIDKPAQITQAPNEVEKADWSTMFANPMQMLKYTGKYGMTRPTKAELDAQKSNIYDSITSMFNPSAYVEALKHMGTSVDAADQALLQGFKDGRLSPKDLSNVVGNLSDAGMQALFLSMAPMGGRTWASAIKELRRPALGARIPQEFRGSRLLGPTAETATTESSALQQLAGTQEALPAAKVKAPKVKKKKYEPVSAYEESNVAATTIEISPEVIKKQNEIDRLIGIYNNPEQFAYQWDRDQILLGIKNQIQKLKGELGSVASHVNHPGVYQYPSFMTGSKLEGQVSPKDGTIARSVLEQLVKNKNTNHSEAIAVKDVLSEFEGKRIPYENFKQSLALDIRSAEIIPTDVNSNVGVQELGYKVGVPNVRTGKLEGGVTPRTNLYKDESLGLTKEGESHFKDTPHSFWIRSFPYENSLRILEWQTDIDKLKIPSRVIPGSEEAVDYYPWAIKGLMQQRRVVLGEATISVDEQIKIFKNQIKNLKKNYRGHQSGYDEKVDKMEKGLKIALDHRKQAMKTPSFKEVESVAEGLSLKFLNESLLDAARQGKKYLDVPTAETMFTIEGWEKPNNAKLNPLYEEQSDILNYFISSYSIDETNEIIQAINNVERQYGKAGARDGVEALIKSTIKEKEVIYDRLINRIEKNQPATIGTFNKLDNGSDFEDMYLDFRRKFVDPTYNYEKIEAKKKEIITYIKKVKLEDVKRAQEDIIKYKENLKKIDGIESRPFDIKDIGGENPTDEQKEKMAEFYSLTEDYRNTPKLFKSTFGTDAIPFTDEFGNTYNRVVVPEKFFQTDPSKPLEIKTYKKGGKALKGLVKKYGAGGSVNGWGAQGNFTTEYTSRQPEVEELPNPNALLTETITQQPLEEPAAADGLEVAGMGGYDEVIMGSKSDQAANKIVDVIPVAGMFKKIGEFGSNLIIGESTGEKRKRRQKLAALLFSPHKLLAMRKADKSGDFGTAEADAKAEEERLAELEVKRAEDTALKKKNAFWAADGMKIKNPLYNNGGLFKALRQRSADRRIAKTPVRDASSQEVLEMLASYGPDSPMMQGEYDPRAKEIVMYKDDPDTLKHEQAHAAQYGPLQRLAYRMNPDRSARIQDPVKRKAYRKLSENISPEAYAAFNRAGKLILDKGEEFEAVLDTGVNAAKEKGVNFNVSFEEILSQLKNIPSPTNNMIGLMKFMENKFTKKQRDLILRSIR